MMRRRLGMGFQSSVTQRLDKKRLGRAPGFPRASLSASPEAHSEGGGGVITNKIQFRLSVSTADDSSKFALAVNGQMQNAPKIKPKRRMLGKKILGR